MKVEFPAMNGSKIVSKQEDLDFSILISNIANKPVRAYKTLWYSRMPSPMANYDCILLRKNDTGYTFVDHYNYEPIYPYIMDSLRQIYSDSVAESIISAFDFCKDTLSVGSTDTLQFNLLINNIYLDSGEYKMQIAFRIGNEYERKGRIRQIAKINYIYSSWYYFRLEKRLMEPILAPGPE